MLKDRFLLLIFSLFLSSGIYAQNPATPHKGGNPVPPKVVAAPATSKEISLQTGKDHPLSKQKGPKIKWLEPRQMDLLNGAGRKVLNFDGAAYTKDFLPIYIERMVMPAAHNLATATLQNPVWEVLDAASQALVNKKQLGASVVPQVIVTYERKVPTAEIKFVPLRLNPVSGQIERLVTFELKLSTSEDQLKRAMNGKKRSVAASSVLATGTWYRIGVPSTGVYKLSRNYMKSIGVDVSTLDLRLVKIYGNGGGMLPFQNSAFRYDDLVQNAISVVDLNGNNKMDSADYILFYGISPNTWTYNASNPAGTPKYTHTINKYTDTTFYFINTDLAGPARRISSQASAASSNKTVTSFDDYSYSENDAENLILSGREWYGEQFDVISSYTYPFNFPNLDPSSPVTVRADLVARNDGAWTVFNLSCESTSGNFSAAPISVATYWADYAMTADTSLSFIPTASPSLSVTVSKVTPSPAIGWMNFVEVNARRKLIFSSGQLSFRDANSVGVGNVSNFTLTNVNAKTTIWEVTDRIGVKSQNISYAANILNFALPTDSLREFIAFDSTGSFLSPVSFGAVVNQNLHATAQVDLIIVSHPNFMVEANRLAALHSTRDNLSSVVVTPQQIYNEFSSGQQDVTAIRDFVKMFYDRSTSQANLPKYLLLFGDGSYDPKHRIPGNSNYIVAFENADALNYSDSYVSDEFFGLLDNSEGGWDSQNDVGAVDIGIGRFPARTADNAKAIVDKIEKYMSLGSPPPVTGCNLQNCSVMRDWRNVVCFMADDGDGGTHLLQAEQLSTMVDTGYATYNIDKIYLDSYQEEMTPGGGRYPSVVDAINKRMDKGALIFNYTGHGGTVGLSHKRVVENQQINDWSNLCNLPFFVTATCEFAQYDDPAAVSAGELILLNPNGAGIGLLSTVRLVFSTPNFNLNQNFYRCAFKPINGQMPRLGDLYRITKVTSGNLVNNRNFSLLADPALRLAYPEQKTKTSLINSTVITSTSIDTLQALGRLTVKGYVCDSLGNKLTNFNGTVYPTVFDKASSLTTLSNDGSAISPAITFQLQKNVIYSGKSTIAKGDFQFSFVVPKDIAYQYGQGKISYYFENGVNDGAGYFRQLVVGGSAANPVIDKTGPRIRLYLNDSTFQYGGTTNENPRLYAILFDSSGVNTVGNGIGHDIVAILDENSSNPAILNDYYTADLNTYKSGKVVFPYSSLTEGTHTLKMKVWDVYDNSSQTYTEFVVSSAAQLALKHVLNYPNPFTTHTSFFFEDNECCQTLNVEIEIFTVTGKLVKTIETNIYTEGYRSPPIDWDGRDDFGDKIGRGVYIYKLSVRSQGGGMTEKLEKLVILN
jgi:hypothetical protein